MKSFLMLVFANLLLFSGKLFAGVIPLDNQHWQFSKDQARFVDYQGRPSIKVSDRARVKLIGENFHNGVIEFDIRIRNKRGFPGIHFRESEKGNSEVFYLRPNASGTSSANQYTPSFNDIFAWQLYTGARYGAAVSYHYDNWNRVKLVVSGEKMDVYINSEKPVLHIEKLAHGDIAGGISFQGSLDDYYLSNIRISHQKQVKTRGTAVALKPLPENLVSVFSVATMAVASDDVEAKGMLEPSLINRQNWTQLPVNELGMANLARVAGRTKTENTLLVKLTLASDQARLLRLQYGFSDRLTLFVNGQALSHSDHTFKSQDDRFYGTVGLFDSVFLPLKSGQNDIVFAVTEGFGGWGLMAALEQVTGVNII
ncbi:hypothetical protein [Thalassomonas sp. RHCl1]|uniref:hypothetical protein n=1 Tax=Thalassomonas sp. RHCl1 TaxID=2995320 RepID=UPI00248B3DCA|nr:hypothetical protein [Thalassomonas sp. RHCl1]